MLVTDIVPPAELNAFVRTLDPAAYGFTLAQFLPNQERQDIEVIFNRSDQIRVEAGQFRSFDVPSAIIGRPGFERVKVPLPPISMKMPLGEEARLQLDRIRGFSSGLADQVFDDAGTLTESVQARIELARGEALTKGTVSFTVDAGFHANIKLNFGTTTTVTAPGVLWTTPATATPIADLLVMCQDYANANGGVRPAYALTSQKVITAVLRCTEVKNYAAFQGIVPSIVSLQNLGQILDVHSLPPLIPYDTTVNVNGSNTRVTGLNELTLLPAVSPQNFGQTAFGITADALELVNANFETLATAPGLVGTVTKTQDPVAHWTKVAGLVAPYIKDPKKIANVTVAA